MSLSLRRFQLGRTPVHQPRPCSKNPHRCRREHQAGADVIAEPKAAKTIAGLTVVPSFPPVALHVMELLSSDALDLLEVAAAIESDAAFAGRILQHANSVEFGFTSPVYSVRRALALLGADRVREIAATVATSLYIRAATKTEELRRCWRHSLACAILSDTLARAAGVHIEHAYTAGLMHDIGRLSIFVAYPEEYIAVMREAATRCIDLLDFERECFGMEHAEAGRWLVERWGLPDYFRVIAGRHHDPPDGAELDLLTIVHLACRLADHLGFDVSRPLIPQTVDAILSEFPPAARSRLPQNLKRVLEDRIDVCERYTGTCELTPNEEDEERKESSDSGDAFETAGARRNAAIVPLLVGGTAILAALVAALLGR